MSSTAIESEDVFVFRQFPTNEVSRPLVLTLYRPVQTPSGDYTCTFKIAIANEVLRRQAIWGIDGVQSLILAMAAATAEIDAMPDRVGALEAWMLDDLRQIRRSGASGP